MLKTVKWFVLGIVVCAAVALWFCGTRHVVRSEQGLRVVKKAGFSFEYIYVDQREWGPLDYLSHPVAKAILAEELEASRDAAKQAVEDARREINQGIEEVKKSFETPPKK